MPSDKNQTIFLNRPNIGNEEQEACLGVLRSRILVQGPESEAFENEFAAKVNARHAISVSSGTAALLLSIKAMGLRHDDEVIIPDYTFIATANAVALAGAKLVLADVCADTLNLDPASASQVLSTKSALVVPVHQYGLSADTQALRKNAPDIPILEDAACALGAGNELGSIGCGPGIATCFSFHPRKVITTGEGGMISTNDSQLAARIKSLRQHGMGSSGMMEPGYNLRMNEMAAALGRVQLTKLEQFLEDRREVARWYKQGLNDLPWLQLPVDRPGRVYQSYVVQVLAESPIGRDELIDGLRNNAIQCQAGIDPVHFYTPYKNAVRCPLPVSERLVKTALFLPMFCGLRQDEVERVCSVIRELAKV